MDNVFSFLKESAAKYPEKAFLVDRNKNADVCSGV